MIHHRTGVSQLRNAFIKVITATVVFTKVTYDSLTGVTVTTYVPQVIDGFHEG